MLLRRKIFSSSWTTVAGSTILVKHHYLYQFGPWWSKENCHSDDEAPWLWPFAPQQLAIGFRNIEQQS